MNYKQREEEKRQRCQEYKKENPENTFEYFLVEMFGESWELEPSHRIAELKVCWNAAIENVTEAMMDAGATLEGQAFPADICLMVEGG